MNTGKAGSTCGTLTGASDPLAATTTGATSLRYDAGTNQFIYNWSTPSTPGCYDLIITFDSGQTFDALFHLQVVSCVSRPGGDAGLTLAVLAGL